MPEYTTENMQTFAAIRLSLYADLPEFERSRLRAAFAAGFASGSGCAWQLPDDPELASLMDAVADDYLAGLDLDDAPLISDAPIPAWLQAMRDS